jgi:hypothetical protein
MNWRDFFNRPKYVLGLIATIVGIWLLFNPHIIADLINRVVMPLLMNLLVIAIIIWGIKIMIFGGKKGGKK